MIIPRNTTLERHMIHKHSFTKPCQYCDEIFFSNSDLRKHEGNKHQDRYQKDSVSCEICGAILKNKNNLESHMNAFHTSKEDRPKFYCELCPKFYYRKSSLNLHIRKHNDIRPFMCTFEGCGKAFLENSTRKVHERIHSREAVGFL